MQLFGSGKEDLFRLWNVWVGNTTVDWTYRCAGFLIIKTNTFRTFLRNDIKNIVGNRFRRDSAEFPLHSALIDRGVRTLGLTRPTVNAIACDYCSHSGLISLIKTRESVPISYRFCLRRSTYIAFAASISLPYGACANAVQYFYALTNR